MKNIIPVIVLTPIKNESWILEKFLTATSVFADIIIIADQNSKDGSIEIAQKFEKVVLIKIPNDEYNEAFRQKLLIEKARELIPGKKLLIALDADEFIAGNSIFSANWVRMMNAPCGSSFSAEKVDLLDNIRKYVRNYPPDFLNFAFVDDDSFPHEGSIVHSCRIPKNTNNEIIHLSSLTIIHFARVRRQLFWDKKAFYCMTENISKKATLLGRIGRNSKRIYQYFEKIKALKTPSEWIEPWLTKYDVNLKEFKHLQSNQFKIQIIKLFMEYGEKRFYLDDIWDTDWNAEVKNLKDDLSINETFLIKGPNAFYKLITSFAVFLWIIRKTNRTIDLASLKLMKWIRKAI